MIHTDSIPTLAQALNGTGPAIAIKGPRRVHRIGKPDEDVDLLPSDAQPPPISAPSAPPEIQPFGRPPKKEKPMPTGVYPRKPRAKVRDLLDDAKPTKRKAAKKKSAKLKNFTPIGSAPAKSAKKPVGAASFVVNDGGHLSILDGQQRIDLERADVKRLIEFLDRTKGLRP